MRLPVTGFTLFELLGVHIDTQNAIDVIARRDKNRIGFGSIKFKIYLMASTSQELKVVLLFIFTHSTFRKVKTF